MVHLQDTEWQTYPLIIAIYMSICMGCCRPTPPRTLPIDSIMLIGSFGRKIWNKDELTTDRFLFPILSSFFLLSFQSVINCKRQTKWSVVFHSESNRSIFHTWMKTRITIGGKLLRSRRKQLEERSDLLEREKKTTRIGQTGLPVGLQPTNSKPFFVCVCTFFYARRSSTSHRKE